MWRWVCASMSARPPCDLEARSSLTLFTEEEVACGSVSARMACLYLRETVPHDHQHQSPPPSPRPMQGCNAREVSGRCEMHSAALCGTHLTFTRYSNRAKSGCVALPLPMEGVTERCPKHQPTHQPHACPHLHALVRRCHSGSGGTRACSMCFILITCGGVAWCVLAVGV